MKKTLIKSVKNTAKARPGERCIFWLLRRIMEAPSTALQQKSIYSIVRGKQTQITGNALKTKENRKENVIYTLKSIALFYPKSQAVKILDNFFLSTIRVNQGRDGKGSLYKMYKGKRYALEDIRVDEFVGDKVRKQIYGLVGGASVYKMLGRDNIDRETEVRDALDKRL